MQSGGQERKRKFAPRFFYSVILSGVVVREASNNGVEGPLHHQNVCRVEVLRFAQDDKLEGQQQIPCVPWWPLWLNSIRESSHRHPSHDGIRDWHLHPERGPNAGSSGPR